MKVIVCIRHTFSVNYSLHVSAKSICVASDLLEFLEFKFKQFDDVLVGLICTQIQRTRFDVVHFTAKNRFLKYFMAVIVCAFRISTGDIVAVQVC